MFTRITTGLLPLLLAAVVLAGCVSAEIPGGLTAAELIQRGQEYAERGSYVQARPWFEAVLERYGTDMDKVCAAEYEIAHGYYKLKQYTVAKERLDALLVRYDQVDAELLPPQYKRLAEIVLGEIERKTGA
jgi:outer membrane protein assembly factor BamD (BamD/ComL family)